MSIVVNHPNIYRIIAFFLRIFTNGRQKDVFLRIYRKNLWKSRESISGPGSTIRDASKIIDELPRIIRKYEIKSILDIPCGDFNWMQNVDLCGASYIGADIVPEIIKKNRMNYPSHPFAVLDLLKDKIPLADMVICRDCLVHFTHKDVFKAIDNIKRSGARWLLTTSFVDQKRNINIFMGDWHPLNLSTEPFNLNNCVEVINEGCKEYKDKSLVLYRLND